MSNESDDADDNNGDIPTIPVLFLLTLGNSTKVVPETKVDI